MAEGSARPTGTVAFLFTDIEGSTQRWESHREAMDDAVKRHDAVLRDAIGRHNGYVFKAVGDAFCVAFARVSDAVAAALEAQRALRAEDFSAVGGLAVRIGLHAGEAAERHGDYFGPAVNRVARLMAIGYGGQILVSGVTRDLAHNDLPAGATLIDLGSHRLRGLSEPERVWQLTIDGMTAEFPALNSLDSIPNNLPIQQTSFRGREHDVEEVKALLSEHKLLTLFGAGGIGKTRLALQVGADVLDRYPDGVWLIDLAAIADPELVASVIAKEIGMPQGGDQRIEESIPRWLRRKNVLLILDNCEHVLEPVAAIADAITRSCAGVRLLTTSRQALGVGGEKILQLATLDESGAVALFADRASLVDKSFKLTDENAPVVAEICRRLDGIPLAIELAAARAKVLSIRNLAQRLDERFKILTGGSRAALPRQKTLGALIDWSYDLLTPEEQLLFGRVGVFAGGFSLDAAGAVCGDEDVDEIDVLDLLASLTDKSLVVADTTGEHERYHLLESTRAYALEKLATAGARDRFGRRHAEYFRDRALEADERQGIGSASAWLAGVELELDNYRAALEWSLKSGDDPALAGALVGALAGLWHRGGHEVEGRHWIGLVQARLDDSAHPQVAARMWGMLSGLSSGNRARDCAQRALALYETSGDQRGQSRALASLAFSLFQIGELDEADVANARALAARRALGNTSGVADSLNVQGAIRRRRSDVAGARESFAQALATCKALGDEDGVSVILGNLAELEFGDGLVEQAARLAGEALEIQARGKNAAYLAISHNNIAAYRIALGDVDGARDAAREGLRLARQVQYAFGITIALQHFALCSALRGDVNDAARLLGYVNAQYIEFGSERQATEKWGHERLMDALRERLSDAEIESVAAEGAAWSEDRAVDEALKA